MKFTKTMIKALIKEVMEEEPVTTPSGGAKPEPTAAAGAPSEEKQESDVKTVLAYISKIDNPLEYAQLVKGILSHAVPQKGAALRKLDANIARAVLNIFPEEKV